MARQSALLCLLLAIVATCVSAVEARAAESDDDAFVRGYVAAVLERELEVSVESVSVSRGVVTVVASDLDDAGRQALVDAISSIKAALTLGSLLGGSEMTLEGRVDNLFDQKYETFGYSWGDQYYYWPAAGRNWFITMKLAIQ